MLSVHPAGSLADWGSFAYPGETSLLWKLNSCNHVSNTYWILPYIIDPSFTKVIKDTPVGFLHSEYIHHCSVCMAAPQRVW